MVEDFVTGSIFDPATLTQTLLSSGDGGYLYTYLSMPRSYRALENVGTIYMHIHYCMSVMLVARDNSTW